MLKNDYLCTHKSGNWREYDTKQALQFLQGGEESRLPAGVPHGAWGGV